MFRSIIWGTDGSEDADRAFPTVKKLGLKYGAHVTVVHDDEHFTGRAGGHSVLADEPELRAKLRHQVFALREAGVDAELMIRASTSGEPADEIAEVAGAKGADVIVVATRGHGRFAGALLGSVAQRLLHVAPCPVLVIPTNVEAEHDQPTRAHATA